MAKVVSSRTLSSLELRDLVIESLISQSWNIHNSFGVSDIKKLLTDQNVKCEDKEICEIFLELLQSTEFKIKIAEVGFRTNFTDTHELRITVAGNARFFREKVET